MKNLNIEMVADSACNTARANGKLIPFELIIDQSASMSTMLDGGDSRYASVIPALISWLESMCKREMLLDNLQVTIRGFNSNGIRTYAEGVLLGDLDIDQVKHQLENTSCVGCTPLGKCLCGELAYLQNMKKQLDAKGIARYQPILALISDDEESGMDSLTDAISQLDALLAANRLTFLPVGIGDAGTDFPNLTRMMRGGVDGECKVLTCKDDLARYFRFLGQTLGVARLKPTAYSDFLNAAKPGKKV